MSVSIGSYSDLGDTCGVRSGGLLFPRCEQGKGRVQLLLASGMSSLQGSIIAGETWCQSPEAAGHMASTIMKQRMVTASAQITFSFFWGVTLWKGTAQIGGGFFHLI